MNSTNLFSLNRKINIEEKIVLHKTLYIDCEIGFPNNEIFFISNISLEKQFLKSAVERIAKTIDDKNYNKIIFDFNKQIDFNNQPKEKQIFTNQFLNDMKMFSIVNKENDFLIQLNKLPNAIFNKSFKNILLEKLIELKFKYKNINTNFNTLLFYKITIES